LETLIIGFTNSEKRGGKMLLLLGGEILNTALSVWCDDKLKRRACCAAGPGWKGYFGPRPDYCGPRPRSVTWAFSPYSALRAGYSPRTCSARDAVRGPYYVVVSTIVFLYYCTQVLFMCGSGGKCQSNRKIIIIKIKYI
jgi:hypothetical protein